MPRPRLPADVIEAMRRLSDEEGLSIRKIAAFLGVSKSCVDYYLYGYGNKGPEALERRWRRKLPAMKEEIRKAANAD